MAAGDGAAGTTDTGAGAAGSLTGAGSVAGSGADASAKTLVTGARANQVASPSTMMRGRRFERGTRDSESLPSLS